MCAQNKVLQTVRVLCALTELTEVTTRVTVLLRKKGGLVESVLFLVCRRKGKDEQGNIHLIHANVANKHK